MTADDAHELVTYLVAAFPMVKVSDDTVRVYIGELADLPYRPALAACRLLVRQGGLFFPAISEIRKQTMVEHGKQRVLGLEDQRPSEQRGAPIVGERIRKLVEDLTKRRAMERQAGE